MAKIVATYPSGKVLRMVGMFRVVEMPRYPDGVPAVFDHEDRVVLLDPRAVVTSNGLTVYTGPKDIPVMGS